MNTERTSPILTLLAGVGIGAALAFFLEPSSGARRRHLVGDKALSLARRGGRTLRGAATGVQDRATGAAAELRGRLQDEDVSDEQLVARVRAELGRHTERARPIEVVADGGTVILRGPVLADDISEVVAAVSSVRGVSRVDNQLVAQSSVEGSATRPS
jgi:osmotically-inducible protein OsmY